MAGECTVCAFTRRARTMFERDLTSIEIFIKGVVHFSKKNC